jgi:phospholipase/carboxylesterase
MTVRRYADLALQYVLNVPSGQPDGAEMPLVFCLHGRGADANDLADLAPMIDGPSGYRFIFPNAPKPFEPYPGMTFGYSWFDGLPPERDSIAASRNLLLRFIDQALGRYPPPSGKVIMSGFSQGGLMAIDVGFRTQQSLAGIVVMSGALYEDDLPDFKKRVPVLIVHGTQDEMINVNLGRRARRVLEQHGIEVKYHEFPMGHFVTPESMAVVGDFIRRRLETVE